MTVTLAVGSDGMSLQDATTGTQDLGELASTTTFGHAEDWLSIKELSMVRSPAGAQVHLLPPGVYFGPFGLLWALQWGQP